MKVTDFAPRTAILEYYLKDSKVPLVGAEVGVDAGAHAESILTWMPVDELFLIDTWENFEMRKMCEARLKKFVATPRGRNEICYIRKPSHEAVFEVDTLLDFLYLDQLPTYEAVHNDLVLWGQKMNPGGLIVHRNYAMSKEGVFKAVNEYVKEHKLRTEIHYYHQEIAIWV